jgi:hypothetical protein
MNNTPVHIKLFLSMLLMQAPTMLVCLAACLVILARGKLSSQSSLWALLGFGSVLLLCMVIPLVQSLLQGWVSQGGYRAERMWVLSTFSFIWSVLHATTYVFLLLAILAGRPTSDAPQPSPLNK